MALRALCGECKRVVPVRTNRELRTHRVTEDTPLLCTGMQPVLDQVFDITHEDVQVIEVSALRRMRERLASVDARERFEVSHIADLESELAVLRNTHSRIDRSNYEKAVDVVLNSGLLNMRQLQIFWQVAAGDYDADRFAKEWE